VLTRPWLPLSVFLLLAAGLAWVACGGGGDGAGEPLSLSEIPTATPPDQLPEVRIVSGTPAGPSGGQRYTVQAGDNPSVIADQFDVSLEELMEANGIVDPTSLYVGQELIIPGAAPERQVLGATATPRPRATTRPTPTAEPQPDGNTYIVREGDIPETIAAQFGITAEELMAANGITDPTSLDIGQELVIPTPRPTPAE
jgi:LysM repeat protein